MRFGSVRQAGPGSALARHGMEGIGKVRLRKAGQVWHVQQLARHGTPRHGEAWRGR